VAGKQTDLIVMDISKGFDKVDHKLLIYKLLKLGLNKHTVLWIQSFLESRSQAVVVDGQKSCHVWGSTGLGTWPLSISLLYK